MSSDSQSDDLSPLTREDWDFEAVPDEELVACCLWEYARESRWIRAVRARCLDPRWREMLNSELWEWCGYDIEKIQSLGHVSKVFLQGFFCDDSKDREARHPEAPPITGSFPKPWQTLSKDERNYRAKIDSDRKCIPLVPFQRGHGFMAQTITENLQLRRQLADEERQKVIAKNPGVSELQLCEEGKIPVGWDDAPSVFYGGGAEVGLFQIEWDSFTNEELRDGFYQWVKECRPANIKGPDGRGQKLISQRVSLEQLGILRLLHHFPLKELIVSLPDAWRLYANPNRRWQKDIKSSRARLHQIFPFLPDTDLPVSWPPRK